MGIDRYTLWAMQGIPQNDVRRFAPDTREPYKIRHGGRDLPMVLGKEHITTPLYATRFLTVETRRLNVFGEGVEVGGGIVRSAMVFLKEATRDSIDALIGALGRKNRGNEQF
jgi:hypothetical protein